MSTHALWHEVNASMVDLLLAEKPIDLVKRTRRYLGILRELEKRGEIKSRCTCEDCFLAVNEN